METTDKKLQIINSAEALFAQKGFSGTSVRDIAQNAGVNLAMISYYFGSKEKLMEAIFHRKTEHMQLQVESLLQNDELSPLQKVNMLLDNYIEKVMSQPQFQKIMLREQMAEKNNVISGLVYELKKRNQDLIKKLVQDGQKKNVFKKNIDIPLMMATMSGTVMNIISTQDHYRDLNNLQDMTDSDFEKLLKKKLSTHLKMLFKAILTYEI